MEDDKKYPKVFKKQIRGRVGGRYINSRGFEDEFLLVGDPDTADIEKITVEVTDVESEKYFIKNNKVAIVQGYLVEITEGYEMTLDVINAVSDGDLKEILKQPFGKMKKRVLEFTSPVPIDRLLTFARAENKPVKTVQFLEEALSKYDHKPITGVTRSDGGVMTTSTSG